VIDCWRPFRNVEIWIRSTKNIYRPFGERVSVPTRRQWVRVIIYDYLNELVTHNTGAANKYAADSKRRIIRVRECSRRSIQKRIVRYAKIRTAQSLMWQLRYTYSWLWIIIINRFLSITVLRVFEITYGTVCFTSRHSK